MAPAGASMDASGGRSRSDRRAKPGAGTKESEQEDDRTARVERHAAPLALAAWMPPENWRSMDAEHRRPGEGWTTARPRRPSRVPSATVEEKKKSQPSWRREQWYQDGTHNCSRNG